MFNSSVALVLSQQKPTVKKGRVLDHLPKQSSCQSNEVYIVAKLFSP